MSYNLSITPMCADLSYLGPSLSNVCPGSQYIMFMSLLDILIRSKGRVSQLCERVKSVSPSDYYNFVVVGGGAGGSVVASRLSENPEWKVLLLEAGPDEPPGAEVPSMVASFLGTEIDWQYRTTNEANACLSTNGSCGWPRGKNLGGTTVHHGMMYMRGHAKDYNDWADQGNPGWSWDDVLPYFRKSENNAEFNSVDAGFHATGGLLNVERFPWQPPIVQNVLDAAREKGYGVSNDLNGRQILGFTVAQTTSENGVRVSSASAFLRPARKRSNLHIALNATATKLIIQNKKVVGVRYVQNGKEKVVKVGNEVVVSGGAVDSPKLLLLSGIGPEDHLKSVNVPVVHNLPGVGENLHNHVSFTLQFTINQPNYYDLNWASVAEYMGFQRGPMSSTGMSQVTGVVASKYTTPDHPDLQFYFSGYQASCAVTGAINQLQDNGNLRTIGVFPTNLHPQSKGLLRLASNNPADHPIIWGNYLSTAQDVATLVEGIQTALSLMNSSSMAKLDTTLATAPIPECSAYTFLSNEYWGCAVKQDTGPENHQAGSCKMGPSSDPYAVVDSQLRVHGIQNLRVADTSIMPQVTSGNTAAPAMMIGEKAADLITQTWKQSQKPACKICGYMGHNHGPYQGYQHDHNHGPYQDSYPGSYPGHYPKPSRKPYYRQY